MSYFEFPHTRTYDKDLGWLIKDAKDSDAIISNILEWIAKTEPTIEEFKAFIYTLLSGDMPEGIRKAIKKWLSENALDLIGSLVKLVFFGITDDGYFVAYIPESWEDIVFGTTGYDIQLAGYDYGHLVLSY